MLKDLSFYSYTLCSPVICGLQSIVLYRSKIKIFKDMSDQTSVWAFAVKIRNGGPQSSTSFPSWKDKWAGLRVHPSGSASVIQKCDSAGLERTNPARSISLDWVPRDNL